jgi:hypothetical protein
VAVRAWCPVCDRLAPISPDGWRDKEHRRQRWRFVEHETIEGKLCRGPERGI